MTLTVVCEARRPHPLAWIHRAEAHSIAEELRGTGRAVDIVSLREDDVPGLPAGPLLLRVSDPVMARAAQLLGRASIPYIGPGASVMERCYDKHEAGRIAAAGGVDCPATALASEAGAMPFPLVLKPRRGSDSIGVRLLPRGPIPARRQNPDFIAQEHVRGAELTIAVYRGRAGMPLQVLLPEGAPYSFLCKYLLRPRQAPLADADLAGRVRETALKIAGLFGVDWAARIDLIHEAGSGRLRFLECDAAPLVGAGSAFAASFAAAGVPRAEQLRLLLNEA